MTAAEVPPGLIDPDGGPDEEDPEFHPDESADAPPWGEEGDDEEEVDEPL